MKIFNPFEKIAGAKALLIGFLFLVLCGILALHNQARYDGVINFHYVKDAAPITIALDLLTNLSCLSFILFVFALLFGATKTRIIDIAGGSALAYGPLVLLPLIDFGKILRNTPQNTNEIQDYLLASNMLLLSLTISISILIFIWHIALLFNAYKVSSNLKKSKLNLSFIIALVLSIAISSYLVHLY